MKNTHNVPSHILGKIRGVLEGERTHIREDLLDWLKATLDDLPELAHRIEARLVLAKIRKG